MKKIIEIYCCDVCEKEVKGKKDLEDMMLPCKETETEVDMTSTLELCAECADKVRNLIFGSFAKVFVYDNGEVHRVELPKDEKPKVDTTVSTVSTRIIPKAAAALEKCAKAAKEFDNAIEKAAEPIKAKEEPAPAKIDDSWGDEVREMLKNGKTVHEIAQHYGLNKSTTYNRMNNLGISPKQYRPR